MDVPMNRCDICDIGEGGVRAGCDRRDSWSSRERTRWAAFVCRTAFSTEMSRTACKKALKSSRVALVSGMLSRIPSGRFLRTLWINNPLLSSRSFQTASALSAQIAWV